jgi:UDP-glucuronate decarboxylase
VARIFNTYGPRMHANDGRVVSNFVIQALEENPLTIYGSGEQTRSFQVSGPILVLVLVLIVLIVLIILVLVVLVLVVLVLIHPQYVSDLVNGLVSLMNSTYSQPVNIGNPEEHSIATFATIIR